MNDSWVNETTVFGENVRLSIGSIIGILPEGNAANRRKIDRSFPCTRIGDRTIIRPFVCVYLGAFIGEDCIVGNHASIREGSRIGARCVIGAYVDVQYSVNIGNDVRIMNNAHITGGTVIGDGSFISAGVMTANHRHVDLDAYDVPAEGYQPPVIGRNVMVGLGALILPGVVIGDHAVIAAGAVVTKSVAERETVAGIPARADWRAVQNAIAAE